MSKLTAIMVASVLALGSAGAAYAQDNTPPEQGGRMMKHHGGERGMEHDMMFKGLNLSDEQRQKMRDIVENAKKDNSRPSAEQRSEWHSLIASDSFDKAKADSVVNQMAQANKAQMLKHLEIQNKMYNVLTPEQKKQFNENFAKRLKEKTPPAAQ
ncbi:MULTISPECIES: ATP-independent periplasmic protein-refolding chaperone Spy [Dickeya]|uniref:Periplasmic protein related to spheroblast formation n=1 Tax=Dickeya aquatica TaxID=1401087 RepID=A0A375A6H7_9GAMM|nr:MULTISPECIES: ATP-independent periplasmic protein-refolding chaperone Spy [Dickeya]SLM61712.1 Spy is an ATP-independent chaperone that suppresses protein aggregation and aids protein refolding in the periplasm (Quan, 2011). Spy is induced by zinc and envelope stress, dependent on both CpxR and BaeSR. Spy and CpxP are paralogs [Dickeya aquatica]